MIQETIIKNVKIIFSSGLNAINNKNEKKIVF